MGMESGAIMDRSAVKEQIISILGHPEADEGLYFRNFFHLHEEDERPALMASKAEALSALGELIDEGRIQIDETQDEMIFRLVAPT